eukprot:m.209957 g.209957  ORF g.209957 m.209957 type:complete len:278 (+) comp25478_c4_seq1:231-1064(+)
MAGPAQTAVDPTTVDPPSVTPLVFTDVERGVFAEVQTALLAEASGVPAEAVRPREIAVVTMLSKCRVDKAVANYVKFVETLGEHGLKISELYQEEATLHSDMGPRFNDNYQVCGVDSGGRAIMWIAASKPTQVSEERIAVHAGVLAWLAVHSDIFTLREGCTFVIDTSQQNHVKKIGNEKKMQRTWQALPLRPQNLFIVGASWGKRIFINAMIKFASAFSSNKVLKRLRFVEMPAVREEVPEKDMPHVHGGEPRCTMANWVAVRIAAFDGLDSNWKR